VWAVWAVWAGSDGSWQFNAQTVKLAMRRSRRRLRHFADDGTRRIAPRSSTGVEQ
jgi:hypothetical protein